MGKAGGGAERLFGNEQCPAALELSMCVGAEVPLPVSVGSPQFTKVQFSQELSQELLWTLSVHYSCL